MPLAPVETMTELERIEYIEHLEREVRLLTAKTNNTKRLEMWEVRLMRRMYEDGSTQRQLADIFDVNRGTVSRIVRGVYYA